jgi:hypothetical protein
MNLLLAIVWKMEAGLAATYTFSKQSTRFSSKVLDKNLPSAFFMLAVHLVYNYTINNITVYTQACIVF